MKEKFKQTSFFSTFRRKLDIFKWQVKKSSREEPILLGIRSTRNNCEVPCDDFEYFDSRNNNCDRIKQIVEKTSGVRQAVTKQYQTKESEIEIFERKFLSSLVRVEPPSTSSSLVRYEPPSVSSSLVRCEPPSSSSYSSLVTVNDGVRSGPGRVMTHHRVLRTSSKDSDCDSGAYSRSSSPEGFDRFLPDRFGEKKQDKSPLQSPNLVLSVIKESDRPSDRSKVDSNLLLSCLSEAGKSSVFSSLDNLDQISGTNHRYYKKNQLRKCSVDPTVTLSGHQTRLSVGRGCSRSETDLRRISAGQHSGNTYKGSHRKYIKKENKISSQSVSSIKICDCQVTVNGQHICNLIY